MFGGHAKALDRQNDAWTLDLTSYAWTELTTTGTKPNIRQSHSSILYNGKMFVFSGSCIGGCGDVLDVGFNLLTSRLD